MTDEIGPEQITMVKDLDDHALMDPRQWITSHGGGRVASVQSSCRRMDLLERFHSMEFTRSNKFNEWKLENWRERVESKKAKR